MCGICGVAAPAAQGPPLSRAALLAMRDSMRHRGPDDAGLLLQDGIALAARRLAILDPGTQGRMPMASPDGRYHIVYNGEIYNFQALRASLPDYPFQTNTDTEVLLALYARDGAAMLEQLNGMFALAIWDASTQHLFLARDRLGIRPLYYSFHGDSLYFASEQKAFFAAGLRPSFNADCLEELLCFGYVAGASSPFAGIRRLLPGEWLCWQAGRVEQRRWWSLAARIPQTAPPAQPEAWFRQTFDDAVALRHIADVRVGALLSGGLDSGSVAASLARQFGAGTATFTLRFPEATYDEGQLAAQLAAQYRLEHQALFAETEDLLGQLRAALYLNDEPFAFVNDLFLHQVARHARKTVSVLLSGEGADETLGGYPRYRGLKNSAFMHLPYILPEALLPQASHFADPRQWFVLYSTAQLRPKSLARLGMMSALRMPYREAILQEAAACYPGDTQRQALYYDQHSYLAALLHRADRMLLGTSVEGRFPFLDHRLVEGLASLPALPIGTLNKPLLRAALGGRLPPDFLTQPKRGFDVPWEQYIQAQPALRDWVAALPELPPFRDSPLQAAALRGHIGEFLETGYRHKGLVVQFMLIALWYAVFFDPA